MQSNLEFSIRGFIVGTIWMPSVECYKPLNYDLTREDARFTEPGTLRDHVLRATNDGDFQSCSIAHGELIARRTIRKDGRVVTVTRTWPLAKFPSIADCLHPEGDDWCPQGDDDENFA
jgi:hypothetical protein